MKGVAFRSVMAAVDALCPPGTRDKAIAAMPRDVGDAFRYGKLVPSGWYGISQYKDMWAAILQATGGGTELVRKIGYECMRADTAGVYRFVMKVLSPETVFAASSRFFSGYYDTGSIDVVERRKGYARAEWRGCVGFDRTMWLEVVASGEALVEMAGGKDARHRIVSGGRDEDVDTVSELFWT